MARQFSNVRMLVAVGVVLAIGAAVAWYSGVIPMGPGRPPQNALLVIAPYWHNGTWVFDDDRFGLVREPFVAGIPEMIDQLVADKPDARDGFRLTFSAQEFPGHEKKLTWIREDGSGNWYRQDDPPMEGWLCPALLKYYEAPPQEIYVKADAIGEDRSKADIASVTDETNDIDEVARNYTRLNQITKEAVFVNPEFARLCVGINQQHVNDARKHVGPHANTSIRIFMNDGATGAFRASAAVYPVGSIIVKEKQGLPYQPNDDSTADNVTTPDGVGGMIKRAPGYDPGHGDWEYFYFEDPSQVEQGRIQSCIDCHHGAAASDYVFGNWSKEGNSLSEPPLKLPVFFSGGHETDSRDGGRPIVLVAAALGVTPEVFRKAFSCVTPARGPGPTGAEARRNKEALLRVLGPHGVTNDRLDEVSDYYRYRPEKGELWRTTPAEAHAIVERGQIERIVITEPGSGYSSPPTATVKGLDAVGLEAKVAFTTDLKTNGSIASVTVMPGAARHADRKE